MRAPVVQRLRYVADAPTIGRRDDPQQQIPVLRAVGVGIEAAKLTNQRRAHRDQMPHVVETAEQVVVELRFERRTAPDANLVDLVFIGVDQIGVGLSVQTLRDFEECRRITFVVVIEQQDEVAGRGGDRTV